MSATVFICERNGPIPGNPTENIPGIIWRATDNSNQTYASVADAILAGACSVEKYNYFKFSGAFNTIANLKVTHTSGLTGYGVSLYSSSSAITSGDCVPYSKPSSISSSVATNNFSTVGSTVAMLVGFSSSSDPASPAGKLVTVQNIDGSPVYSNYIVTQLKTSAAAQPGNITPITFTITYDEN